MAAHTQVCPLFIYNFTPRFTCNIAESRDFLSNRQHMIGSFCRTVGLTRDNETSEYGGNKLNPFNFTGLPFPV